MADISQNNIKNLLLALSEMMAAEKVDPVWLLQKEKLSSDKLEKMKSLLIHFGHEHLADSL